MKKNCILLIIFCALVKSAFSQVQPTAQDSAAIRKAALDYVEGFFNADTKRIAEAVHPELVKRIVYKDPNGNEAIQDMGATLLMFAAAKSKKNDPDPGQPFKAEVSIYDIFNDNATIKIITNKFKFIDYAQLAKVNGKWQIINVLWAYTK